MSYQKNESQIVRKDGLGVIFEVLDYAFPIGKVVINFQKYDKNGTAGNKVLDRVSIFLDFASFIRLANDFTVTNNGPKRIKFEMDKAKSEGKQYYGTQLAIGGSSVQQLQKQKRERPDGNPEYRILKIMPSNKGNGYAISASAGPAKVTNTGGFAPIGKPDSMVQLAISYDDWTEVMLIVKSHIDAYLAAKYSKRIDDNFNLPLQNQGQVQNNGQRPNYNNQAPKRPEQHEEYYVQGEDFGGIGMSSSDPIPF